MRLKLLAFVKRSSSKGFLFFAHIKFAKFTLPFMRERRIILIKLKQFLGGIVMTNNTTNVRTEDCYVITKDGLRVSYEEYLELVRSERN